MTGEPDIMPLFLEIAASPPSMRKAITEACNRLLEGIGPSFTELRRYLNEIGDTRDIGSDDFADLWYRSGNPGTPAGVIHFLTSGLPEGRRTLEGIIRMALGDRLLFVPDSGDTVTEKEKLTAEDLEFLRGSSGKDDIMSVTGILDTVPHCAMAVLSQTMGDWYNSDERNLKVPDSPGDSRVVNGWLVHNSDHAEDIYGEGFMVGNRMGYLAYTKRETADDGKYAFAFRIDDTPDPGKSGLKYTSGGASIVFVGTGNVAEHLGDTESQVIFDIDEPAGCFLVKFDGMPGEDFREAEWAVYGKNPGRPLVSGKPYRECLAWIKENGMQYRGQMKEWNRGQVLVEGVFSDFGKKLARGLASAALVAGLIAPGASAAQPGTHSPSAAITQKSSVSGGTSAVLSRADIRKLYASEAYNSRVRDIVLGMLRENPEKPEQVLYEKACAQAIQEVISRKLKP